MNIYKKENLKYYFVLFILILLLYFVTNKFRKEHFAISPISINLITSVHTNLSWNFKASKPKVAVRPGDVTTIEYTVENLGNNETTGIATFAYFPNDFGKYISKINCFCYDAKNLKPGQKDKYTLILLIDPEVTKNSKTKNIKEFTIQFTFFDYNEYKEKKS